MQRDRIHTLDVLRGFAVLGILLMNVQEMSMPEAAYVNPHAWGSLDGANGLVWLVSRVFVDLKFVSIFSVLFGAGLALLSRKADTATLVRRQGWLLAFGLVHAYAIWPGDILASYAVCGLVVIALRNSPNRTLLRIAAVLFPVSIGLSVVGWATSGWWPPEALEEMSRSWLPTAADVAPEIAAYRGGWWAQMDARLPSAIAWQTGGFALITFWRSTALMLVGIVLLRTGVLGGEKSNDFYRRGVALGFGLGVPLVLAGVVHAEGAGALEGFFLAGIWNDVGSVGVAWGWICGVILATKRWPLERLGAVGRMAFTNYLAQSVIGTFVFFGHGLGLFASVSRVGQFGVVVAIWMLELAWSAPLLARLRQGPMEWAWRSLTWRRIEPIRRKSPDFG